MNAQTIARTTAATKTDLFGADSVHGQLPALSAGEAQQFADQGFLVLPSFCSEVEVHQIRVTLSTLFRDQIGHDEGSQFDMLGLDHGGAKMRQPQILNPSVYEPELLRTEHALRVTAVARQLLGRYAQFSFDHGILKPAHNLAATPWHQDEAHHQHRHFRFPQISFWLALQDTSVENGCMRYMPRSHLGPLLPHRPLNNDPRMHAIECAPEYVNEAYALDRPVKAGTCILHDSRTLHAALPNISVVNRMAYIVAFVGQPQPLDEQTRRTMAFSKHRPADVERRSKWLRRGGFLTVVIRRLRQGLRSHPRTMWEKLKLRAGI